MMASPKKPDTSEKPTNCDTCGDIGVVYHKDYAIKCHCVEPPEEKEIGGEG